MYSDIDPKWVAEFAGFFWGEGNFMIDQLNKKFNSRRKLADGSIADYGEKTCFQVRVRARLIQRQDNRAVLEDIQSKLGGHITTFNAARTYADHVIQPTISWQIQHVDQVSELLDLLDLHSSFRAKKRLEIPIVREAVTIMKNRVYAYSQSDRDRITELRNLLKSMREYA